MEKQLLSLDVDAVLLKAKRGQGLTAKEFAVATGFSYPVARAMFKDRSFPAFRWPGATTLLFWSDWELYRRRRTGISRRVPKEAVPRPSVRTVETQRAMDSLPPAKRARIERILSEVG